MSPKVERLIKAIREARDMQGLLDKDLAVAAGASQGTISVAMAGKAGMSEQKWRLICERLGISYDEIVADPDEDAARSMVEMYVQDSSSACADTPVGGGEVSKSDTADTHSSMVVARYLADKIKRDIAQGTDMALDDVWTLLDFVRRLQASDVMDS